MFSYISSALAQVPQTIQDLFLMLQSALSITVAGGIMSLLVEKLDYFKHMPGVDRDRWVKGLVIGIAVAAWAVTEFVLPIVPPETLVALNKAYGVVVTMLGLYLASQLVHGVRRKPDDRPELDISGTVEGDVTVSKPVINVENKEV